MWVSVLYAQAHSFSVLLLYKADYMILPIPAPGRGRGRCGDVYCSYLNVNVFNSKDTFIVYLYEKRYRIKKKVT